MLGRRTLTAQTRCPWPGGSSRGLARSPHAPGELSWLGENLRLFFPGGYSQSRLATGPPVSNVTAALGGQTREGLRERMQSGRSRTVAQAVAPGGSSKRTQTRAGHQPDAPVPLNPLLRLCATMVDPWDPPLFWSRLSVIPLHPLSTHPSPLSPGVVSRAMEMQRSSPSPETGPGLGWWVGWTTWDSLQSNGGGSRPRLPEEGRVSEYCVPVFRNG